MSSKTDCGSRSPFSRRTLFLGAGTAAMLGGARGMRRQRQSSPSAGGSSAAGHAEEAAANFRLGVTGGGAKDIFDGQNIITKPDQARLVSAFETLLTFDDEYQLQHRRPGRERRGRTTRRSTRSGCATGIEFQDGKTLTADDVIYSLQRIGTENNGLTGFAATATMDITNIKKMDDRTVRLPLLTPDSTIPQTLGQLHLRHRARSATRASTATRRPRSAPAPTCSKSFTPGQESVQRAQPELLARTGQPYFDTGDDHRLRRRDRAGQRALLGGQIDAMTDVPAAQVDASRPSGAQGADLQDRRLGPAVHGDRHAAVRRRPTCARRCACIVDRQQMIDQVALGLRLRRQRPLRAVRRRLRQRPAAARAGHRPGQVAAQGGRCGGAQRSTCTPPHGAAGMVDVANVFADAGQGRRRHGQRQERPQLLRRPLPQAGLLGRLLGHPRLPQPGAAGLAPDLAVQRDALAAEVRDGSNFEDLYKQALAATDDAKRDRDRARDAAARVRQRRLHHPVLQQPDRRLRPKVAGFAPSKGTLNLASFGHGFRTIWFA